MVTYTGKIQIGENKFANTEGFTVVTDTTETPGKWFYEEFCSKSRAKEFVKRWNSHDALLKACKDALPLVERHSLSAAKIQRLEAAIAAGKE